MQFANIFYALVRKLLIFNFLNYSILMRFLKFYVIKYNFNSYYLITIFYVNISDLIFTNALKFSIQVKNASLINFFIKIRQNI